MGAADKFREKTQAIANMVFHRTAEALKVTPVGTGTGADRAYTIQVDDTAEQLPSTSFPGGCLITGDDNNTSDFVRVAHSETDAPSGTPLHPGETMDKSSVTDSDQLWVYGKAGDIVYLTSR